jgi:hypothetical protein
MLLSDIRQIFTEFGAERMLSKTLADSLCAMTDRPWSEAHKGREISQPWLARKLRAFGISPKSMRVADERGNGYELAHFQEAFDRYLPASEATNCDSVTTPANTTQNETFESVTGTLLVTDANACESPSDIDLSHCHGSNPPTQEEVLL